MPVKFRRLIEQPKRPVSVARLLLAGFTFCGTKGIHIFVPALPFAALELGSSPSSIQLTSSLYILGLAFGQLLYGPISDRFGKRPALFGGLCLFAAASLLPPSQHRHRRWSLPGCCRRWAGQRA